MYSTAPVPYVNPYKIRTRIVEASGNVGDNHDNSSKPTTLQVQKIKNVNEAGKPLDNNLGFIVDIYV